MRATGTDHLYAEATSRDASLSSWGGLGFQLAESWETGAHRAGRLTAGDATLVLPETTDSAPRCDVFSSVDVDGSADGCEPSHWGTRMARTRNPDGRTHALEEQP